MPTLQDLIRGTEPAGPHRRNMVCAMWDEHIRAVDKILDHLRSTSYGEAVTPEILSKSLAIRYAIMTVAKLINDDTVQFLALTKRQQRQALAKVFKPPDK
jgi:hypothetical protein